MIADQAAAVLLEQIAGFGAHVYTADDKVYLSRSGGPLPEEVIESARRLKPQLMGQLAEREREGVPDDYVLPVDGSAGPITVMKGRKVRFGRARATGRIFRIFLLPVPTPENTATTRLTRS
jgi:hypothetical protein